MGFLRPAGLTTWILALAMLAIACTESEPAPLSPQVPDATPRATVTAAPAATEEPTEPPPAPPAEVYYANCSEARAAGAAPIRRGEPGYRSGLDRDDDGLACE